MWEAFEPTCHVMEAFELIDTRRADYLLDAGGLRDRFVEIDATTLAPINPQRGADRQRKRWLADDRRYRLAR